MRVAMSDHGAATAIVLKDEIRIGGATGVEHVYREGVGGRAAVACRTTGKLTPDVVALTC